jgi:hypothetical protein
MKLTIANKYETLPLISKAHIEIFSLPDQFGNLGFIGLRNGKANLIQFAFSVQPSTYYSSLSGCCWMPPEGKTAFCADLCRDTSSRAAATTWTT